MGTDKEVKELAPKIIKGMKKHNCANFSHYIRTLIRNDFKNK